MIAIVDYNAGNLTSVKRALDFLQIPCCITADPDVVVTAQRIIFPGVGNAASAMQTLHERGLDRALKDAFAGKTPILGICLGSQIILSRSEEGDTECLGLLKGTCPKFVLDNATLKIPHMGWDEIALKREHPVLRGIDCGSEFYFVHSYYPQPAVAAHVLATCDYGIEFPAVIGAGNVVACQFHPEKSGRIGLEMLRNFSTWDGASC